MAPSTRIWRTLSLTLWAGLWGCVDSSSRTLVLTYQSPLEGAQLTDAQDLDPQSPGLQLDILVRSENSAAGEAIREPAQLESASLEFRRAEASDQDFLPGPPAELLPDGAAFRHLTLGTGNYLLRVSAKQKDRELRAENVRLSLSSLSSTARPEVLTVAFLGDENADRVLNRAELPSFPATARLTLVSAATGTVVAKDQTSGVEYGRATFMGNAVDLPLDGLPPADDQIAALVFEVTNGAGSGNQLSDSSPGNPKNAAAFATLTIDRTPPLLTFTAPHPNQVSHSSQVPVSLQVQGAEGQLLTVFSSAGGQRGTLTVTNGMAQGQLPFLDGPQDLTARVKDAAGNPGQVTVSGLLVQASPDDALSLLAPTDGQVLNLSSDLSNDPGIQFAVSFSPPPPAGGEVDLCISVEPSPGASPCANSAPGWFTLARSLPASNAQVTFPEGQFQLRLVQKWGGAFSGDQSVPVGVTVDGQRPALTALSFQGDSNSDLRLNSAELPNGQPTAIVSVSEACTVQVKNASGTEVYGSAVAAGPGLFSVPLLNLPPTEEGDFQLEVLLVDSAGNTNQRNASAPDFNAQAFSSLRIDRVAPTWTFVAPAKTLLGLPDDASADPDFQLRVSGTTASDVGLNGVSLSLSGGATVVLTPASGTASYDFTVPSSGVASYTLSVTVTDASGNSSDPKILEVAVDADPPAPQITQPTAALSCQLDTRVEVPGEIGGSVQIFSQATGRADVLVGTLPLSSGLAEGVVDYPADTEAIRAVATDAVGNVGQDVRPLLLVPLNCG